MTKKCVLKAATFIIYEIKHFLPLEPKIWSIQDREKGFFFYKTSFIYLQKFIFIIRFNSKTTKAFNFKQIWKDVQWVSKLSTLKPLIRCSVYIPHKTQMLKTRACIVPHSIITTLYIQVHIKRCQLVRKLSTLYKTQVKINMSRWLP